MLPYELIKLLSIYQTKIVTHVCKSCGDQANSYVNYYGKKKQEDKKALNKFLRSGPISAKREDKLYSMLNNAGYY